MAPITNNGPAPSSETLTYDYRNSMRGWDIVTQVVCLVISTICVALRMFSKLFIVRDAIWEDWTCLLAWLGLIGYGVICFEADKHGSGIHQWLVAESDARDFSKIANIAQISYGPLIFITKLSILLLYIRIFTTAVQKTTRYMIIQLLIWFNFFFYLADTIVKIFECTPRHKIWEKTAEGSCININIPILVTSAINVASDFMILLLPIACVLKLKQMTRTKKLGVLAIFAAGSFGCCASVVRLVFSIKNSNTADKTHDWFPEFLWATAEVTCGIIASCLPVLQVRYLFRRAATQLSCFSEASTDSSRRHHHNNSPSQMQQQNKNALRRWMATEDSEVLKYSTWELEGDYSTPNDSNDNSNNSSNTTTTTKSNSNANTNYNTNSNGTDTNVSSNNTTELRSPAESQCQIFQGASYSTAEAKADATPLASTGASPDASCVDIEKAYPPQGILRTIEVDVESAPGKG